MKIGVSTSRVPGVFSSALGDIGYIFRSKNLAEMLEIVNYIQSYNYSNSAIMQMSMSVLSVAAHFLRDLWRLSKPPHPEGDISRVMLTFWPAAHWLCMKALISCAEQRAIKWWEGIR